MNKNLEHAVKDEVDCLSGLPWVSMAALNRYLLVDMSNKYSDYQGIKKDKGLTLPVYVRDIYMPQHYVSSIKQWFLTPESFSPQTPKVLPLHPATPEKSRAAGW